MFRIECDITYQDGTLAGLTIPSGYFVNTPDEFRAIRITSWIERVRGTQDFVRAPITGNRYQFASAPRVTTLDSVGHAVSQPLAHRDHGDALCRIALHGQRAYNDAIGDVMLGHPRFGEQTHPDPQACVLPEQRME